VRTPTLQELIQGVLDCFPDVKLCILFGSAATEKSGPDSDLDIAVAAAEALTAARRLELTGAFSAATNRPIDLVDLMAESGLIVKHSISKGVVVRNPNKNLYARIISRMLFDQADTRQDFPEEDGTETNDAFKRRDNGKRFGQPVKRP